MRNGRPTTSRALPGTCAVVLALAAASCRVAESVVQAPGALVGAARGSDAKPAVDLERARQEASALADEIVLQIDLAAFVFAQREGSPAGAEQALSFRISAAERALAAATDPRPLSALVNLVALAAYESRLHESYWSTRYGEADRPLLDAWRQLETGGLAATEKCLPQEQVAAIRSVLAAWRAQSGDAEALASSGAPRFAELLEQGTEKAERSSLLGTIGLDPLDSIEPAAREVARTRELAERGLFLAQRTPRTLAWRLELLTLRLAKQPDVQSVLQDLERTSKAAESVAATAEGLPAKLGTEGDALLRRVSTELAAQRAGIVADLERTSAPTQALLTQAEGTLDAATRLAQALDTTTRSVDAFVARVSPPEPAGGAPAAQASAEPPGKPFDPVEYTALATQATAAIHELNAAVANLDRTLPTVQRGLDDAAARVDRSVETAYELALRLVLIAIGTATVAVLLVRLIGRPRARDTAR